MTPRLSLTTFKMLKVGELKRLESCVITADGEYLFTFINPNTDYCKMQAENVALLSNSVGGESIEEIQGGLIDASV